MHLASDIQKRFDPKVRERTLVFTIGPPDEDEITMTVSEVSDYLLSLM